MAAAVISVEKFTASHANSTDTSTVVMTKGQDIDNCVVFVTMSNDYEQNNVQSYAVYQNGTDSWDIKTAVDSTIAAFEISVVEFDPAEVTVTYGSLASISEPKTVTITEVDLAKTFVIGYWENTDGTDDYSDFHMRVYFSGTTSLVFDRYANNGVCSVSWFIIESVGSAFAVTPETQSYGTSNTNYNVSTTAARLHSAVWSTWITSEDSDDPRDGNWSVGLSSDTNMNLRRGNGASVSASGNIHSFVVEFADDVATCQHGEFEYDTALTKTAAITEVVEENSMVVSSHSLSQIEGTGTSGAKNNATASMSFNSSTEILGTRDDTGNGNYAQKWQVIEWDIADSSRYPYEIYRNRYQMEVISAR